MGWLAVTATLTVLPRPERLESVPLAGLYSTAWLTGVAALLFIWRCRGPAIVGGIATGAIVAIAWFCHLL
jgi:hypothetical protein